MWSLPILSLNTKFQPNWLQNIKAREVFHFWAGWVVGWLGRLACSNAYKSHIRPCGFGRDKAEARF